MEGILQQGALYRSLLELAAHRSTGILTVQGEEEIIAFSLLGGEIVSADALNQTLEEALGELLVKRQLVAPEDYGGLAAEYQSGGGRVVDLLVERAYLTREQLLDILREHTYRLCLEAFTWQRGEYRFYQGEEVAFEDGFRAIGVDELCVRATADLGPSGPLAGGVPGPGALVHRLADDAAPSGDELLGPLAGAVEPALAERLFHLIDGQRSVDSVAAGAGVSLFTFQHLVHRWASDGLVTTTEAATPPEPRSATLMAPAAPTAMDLDDGPSLDFFELDREPELALEEEPVAPRRAKRRELNLATPWPARLMGLGLWAAAIFTLVAEPARLLLPFPWQGGLREAVEGERRAALHLKIEQAATTFFLLNGRFPEELDELAASRLLAPADLTDPSGRPLVLSTATASYVVESLGASDGEQEALRGSIAGNILLDPAFQGPDQDGEPPLVLLD